MHKIYRYLLLTVLALCLSIPALGAEAANIALVPLINNVQGDEIANQVYYNNAINCINAQKGFVLVDNDKLSSAIEAAKIGKTVPDKNTLAKIAKDGNVDIVVAMQLDKCDSEPELPGKDRNLKLLLEGYSVAYNALTGEFTKHRIYDDKVIDEALTSRYDWPHEEWGYAVRREMNRILNVKKIMVDAPRMSKL